MQGQLIPSHHFRGKWEMGAIEAAGMAAALVADAEFPVLLFWWLAISQRVAQNPPPHLAHQQPAAGHWVTWKSVSLVGWGDCWPPQHP